MLLRFLQCALTCLCPKRHQFQCILTLLLPQCKIHPRRPLRALRPPQNCLQRILVYAFQIPSILAISISLPYGRLRHYLTILGQSSTPFQSHAHHMVSTWWPLTKTCHFTRNQSSNSYFNNSWCFQKLLKVDLDIYGIFQHFLLLFELFL